MRKAFIGKVQGRVQGIGYRYFTENAAREFRIAGWVRNHADGSVEVMALGEETNLERFLMKLKKGPFACRVDSIDIDWIPEVPTFQDFRITG